MPWVRVDDGFAQHPKVVAAGPLAMAMQIAALCYCNRALTDGYVPRAVARTLLDWEPVGVTADSVIDVLVEHGMWEPMNGGYHIHDFTEYQPTKEQVIALQEARSEAGRRGGQANAKAIALAKSKQTPSKGLSKIEAKLNPVPDPVPDPVTVSDPAVTTPKSPRPKVSAALPPDVLAFRQKWVELGLGPFSQRAITKASSLIATHGIALCVEGIESASRQNVKFPLSWLETVLPAWKRERSRHNLAGEPEGEWVIV